LKENINKSIIGKVIKAKEKKKNFLRVIGRGDIVNQLGIVLDVYEYNDIKGDLLRLYNIKWLSSNAVMTMNESYFEQVFINDGKKKRD